MRGAAAVICVLLGSCSDGYPTQDATADDPWHFTSAQRVEALNELGEIVDPDERWRFRLESPCSLRVERQASWWTWEGTDHPLRGVDVSIRSTRQEDEQHFELVLTRRGQAEGDVLLSGKGRFGVRRAQAIVHLLQGECKQLQPKGLEPQ